MKLGVIFQDMHNASYRAIWPAESARDREGYEITLLPAQDGRPLKYDSLLDCDLVHVFRRSDRLVIKALDDLRRRGVPITFDNDDDIRLAPKEAVNYKELGGLVGQRDFRTQVNVMRRADVVSTTNEVLAARWAEEYSGPIEVIANSVSGIHFPTGPRNEDGGVVIGWFAGLEHKADAMRLGLTQTLQRVMERRPEVRVVTMGVRLNLDPARYTHYNYIPLHELMRFVRRFDIGIAPISDIPLSYARSDIKVKEYAAAGVPWVASNRGGYARLGAKCGGLLADDDAWEETLVSLVASKFRRAQLRRQGSKWAKTQHIDQQLDRWLAMWQKAIDIAAAAPAEERRTAAVR